MEEKISRFLTGLGRHFWGHPTCQLLLCLKKVGFQRSRGPLGGFPGDEDEVKMEKDRLGQTLLRTPHMPPFACFEKSRFSEVWGDPSARSLRAG